jgi:hypothetical protein
LKKALESTRVETKSQAISQSNFFESQLLATQFEDPEVKRLKAVLEGDSEEPNDKEVIINLLSKQKENDQEEILKLRAELENLRRKENTKESTTFFESKILVSNINNNHSEKNLRAALEGDSDIEDEKITNLLSEAKSQNERIAGVIRESIDLSKAKTDNNEYESVFLKSIQQEKEIELLRAKLEVIENESKNPSHLLESVLLIPKQTPVEVQEKKIDNSQLEKQQAEYESVFLKSVDQDYEIVSLKKKLEDIQESSLQLSTLKASEIESLRAELLALKETNLGIKQKRKSYKNSLNSTRQEFNDEITKLNTVLQEKELEIKRIHNETVLNLSKRVTELESTHTNFNTELNKKDEILKQIESNKSLLEKTLAEKDLEIQKAKRSEEDWKKIEEKIRSEINNLKKKNESLEDEVNKAKQREKEESLKASAEVKATERQSQKKKVELSESGESVPQKPREEKVKSKKNIDLTQQKKVINKQKCNFIL